MFLGSGQCIAELALHGPCIADIALHGPCIAELALHGPCIAELVRGFCILLLRVDGGGLWF